MSEENPRRDHYRVLLLEDDDAFAHVCKRFLRGSKSKQLSVVSASTIAEVLAIVSVDQFDCIVADYNLPDGQGTALISVLNKQLREAAPPLVIMTADRIEVAAVEALRCGAQDFISKEALTATALCRSVCNAIDVGSLRRANHERLRELELTNRLLRQRNKEIQRFYHTVSHEIKTPLTALQEFVAIVFDGLAGDLTEEQKTILGYALESCHQITNHFNDLLELSRFETGKMTVKLEPGDINQVFDHCIVAAGPSAAQKQIDLSISASGQLPMVMMQRDRIIQVLTNMISNAIKFTEPGGAVTVSSFLTDDGNRLKLSVKDTGCGIPMVDQKQVFERLYQVTPSSDSTTASGLGLGLSIASEIVHLHGSRIELLSAVGKGSEFSFELPLCAAQDCDSSEDIAA